MMDGKIIGKATTSGSPKLHTDLCKIFGKEWNRPLTIRGSGILGGNAAYISTQTYGYGSLNLEQDLW